MSETFLYLTTTGRVTGNPHKIEIWYVEYEGHYYLCAEHGKKSDWVKNIMKHSTVQFYIATREQTASQQTGTATIMTDDILSVILHDKFQSKYNWSNGLFVEIVNG